MPGELETRFGILVLSGKPNAGKSTLLNALVGEKLAIVSTKPQSTRTPVMGLVTEGDTQLLFVDPPGLLEPTSMMQESMLECAVQALSGANGVLYLHPINVGQMPSFDHLVPGFDPNSVPVANVFTKADLLPENTLPSRASEEFVVSAKTGYGLDELLHWCRERAVPGEFRYDPEDIGTQPMRFFVQEIVRETTFEVLDQELPYAIAALVDEYRENQEPVYIRVILHVERESQKGIVIGKNGATIRQIGAQSRTKIEELLGERVYLDLWVKVLAKWRKSPEMLRMLGLPVAGKKGSL